MRETKPLRQWAGYMLGIFLLVMAVFTWVSGQIDKRNTANVVTGYLEKKMLDTDAGQEVYPFCVPTEVLRWEDGESYVMGITDEETVLGTRLKAVKLFVTVVAADQEYVAIRGDELAADREIICYADREVEEGDYIWVEE